MTIGAAKSATPATTGANGVAIKAFLESIGALRFRRFCISSLLTLSITFKFNILFDKSQEIAFLKGFFTFPTLANQIFCAKMQYFLHFFF